MSLATKKNKWRGFTLVEITMVMALLMILAILVIPGITRSRIAANNVLVAESLRTINSACQLYHMNNNAFPASLSELASGSAFIDPALASGHRHGYDYTYTSNSTDAYQVEAAPAGFLKGKYFFIDQEGQLKAKTDQSGEYEVMQ